MPITEGPWWFERGMFGDLFIVAEGRPIAMINILPDGQDAINAQAIATLPEILSAIKDTLECGCETSEEQGLCGVCYGVLSRVITKAEGG